MRTYEDDDNSVLNQRLLKFSNALLLSSHLPFLSVHVM